MMRRIPYFCSLPLLFTGCSRSNNLLLGRVQATVGTHTVVVTDCYRTSVDPPQKVEGGYHFMPCRDADVWIRGAELVVNGQSYGPLQPTDPVLVDHSVVFINAHPAQVAAPAQRASAVELDISYDQKSPRQTLDLYLPAKNDFTTIVYTYGGGWHSGSGKSSKPIAEKLQSLGYACALVSHRLWPPDVFPAHAEDVASAFAWVKSNIAARGGDPKRIVLAGHSSGAQLSLIVAADPRYLAPHHLSPTDILAVIGLSSPVDLTRHPDRRGYGDVLLGGPGAGVFRGDSAVMKDASPTEHVSKTLPPTLLVVGEHDFPMLVADASAFAKKAEAANRKVDVMIAAGKDHMAVARAMTDDQDPVLVHVLAFLHTLK
ncbi:MAG TPA: alpha/beta hydrolase [Bryobacteraceae bacterium]|nr:alpha/beta hydrolase [Bryobacteraceae bacterium]